MTGNPLAAFDDFMERQHPGDKAGYNRPAQVACGPTAGPEACAHDFQGWRAFEDGNGGEAVCTRCGLGAMAHSLRTGP